MGGSLYFFLSLHGRKGGQVSSEDLFPLGYEEWESIPLFSSPLTGED
jgi:hypothetical protein